MFHLNFDTFLGNERVVEILKRTIERDRVPHALIFSGPHGVGKKTLALLLAQRMICLRPRGINPCGACGSCRKIYAGMHPDVGIIQPEGAVIKIEQVRSIIGEIAFQPFESQYRFVILDGAEQMRQEAANSLLKTLEEPPSRTIIILVTTQPYLMLGTIRSRSRMLQFGPIPQDLIAEHLAVKLGRASEDARLAATFCNGSLGAALDFDIDRYREVRKQALRFVRLLLTNGKFSDVSDLAAGLAKVKGAMESWMESVTVILHDIYYCKVAPSRIVQQDLKEALSELSTVASKEAVVSSIEAVKKLKGELFYNVNRQIALESLFLSQASSRRTGPNFSAGYRKR